jgi:ATP-dependent RNA helicase RhlE
MQFADLRLAEPILRAVLSEGYTVATPIQAQAIPHILKGKDVLGSAQTGTGKTAAFALPILHRFSEHPRAAGAPHKPRCLILCPTRELAAQIGESFRAYGKNLRVRYSVIFGGVSQGPQVDSLRSGIDVIIATPGRLLDLMNQGFVHLQNIEVFVLDEADRMFDMGFIQDIRKIVAKLPKERQTLLFSATMPTEIRRLAETVLRNPVTVQVAAVSAPAERIEETVYKVQKKSKPALLAHLVENLPMYRTIVFTRTKHGADRVVRHLHKSGIRAEAIHGNKSQGARRRALSNFIANKIPVLVATDIASRGIDVDGITHVVNYDLTHEPETYVHRIGRTARAGASGAAVSFCDHEELPNLKAIEKLIRRTIEVKSNPLPDAPAETIQHKPRVAHEQKPQTAHEHREPSHRHPAPHRNSGHPRSGHHPSSRHPIHGGSRRGGPSHRPGGRRRR